MFLVQALRGMFFGGSSQLYKKTPEKTRREIDNTIIVTLHAAQIYYEIQYANEIFFSLFGGDADNRRQPNLLTYVTHIIWLQLAPARSLFYLRRFSKEFQTM